MRRTNGAQAKTGGLKNARLSGFDYLAGYFFLYRISAAVRAAPPTRATASRAAGKLSPVSTPPVWVPLPETGSFSRTSVFSFPQREQT